MTDGSSPGDVPDAPNPLAPEEPVLPDSQAPSRDETGGIARHSKSYIPAIEDAEFLQGNDARGIRLQLDYLKPELIMREHGIEHTIVVFGGTRITERQKSQQLVDDLGLQLDDDPGNIELREKLSIAKNVLRKSNYYDVARDFSKLVAESGQGPDDPRLVVITGGGPGIMEAANRGASESRAKTIGLNITLPHEQQPNPYLTPELCFQFNYFALRKMHFLLRAKALVAFPGGYGTMDELFETLTLIQTRKIQPLPVVLVGEEFWRKAINVDFLVEEGVIDAEDRDLFWFAETAKDIWEGLKLWYQKAGRDLVASRKSLNN